MTRLDRGDGSLSPQSPTFGQDEECSVEQLVDRILKRVRSLPEASMRAAVLGEQLAAMSAHLAASVLCDIHDGSGRDPLRKDAWAAFAVLVEQMGLTYDETRDLYLSLVDRERRDVAQALLRPTQKHSAPMRSLEPGGRSLTLGERKALARKTNRSLLERLARDPDPSVIRILLQNPKIVEADVVRLAATRLANPLILREIALSNRWSRVVLVVRALLFNPATPLDTKLRLLPTLRSQDIEEVRRRGSHPALVKAAERLLSKAPSTCPTRDSDDSDRQ